MAYNSFKPNRKIRPSILDRLIDDDPNNMTDSPSTPEEQIQSLKENVRRDIENLFNARMRSESPHHPSKELVQSLINYGIPDLATLNLKQPEEQQKLCRELESLIHQFEPRFKTVRVSPYHENQSENKRDFSLRLRIEATLHADPAPETIVFDSIMEPVTRSMNVEVARV